MGERILKMGKPWVLGARLLAARQLADLSQKDAAEKLGISATAVGKYESGDTEPTIAALILISRIYGENLALFLKELEPDSTDDFALDKEAVRIGYRLRHLRGRRPRAWVAHKLGIKREEIRQYELGEVRQPHDRLNFIAKLFDLKLDNIIGKKPIPNHAASITPDLDPDVPPVQFPPLINGLEQNKVCISTDYLNRCKVDDPRAFIAPPGTKLLSYWGILPGDGVLFDPTIKTSQKDAVYVVEIDGKQSLRAIIIRGRKLWLEAEEGYSEPEPLSPRVTVLGRLFYRAGDLIEDYEYGF